MKPETWERLEAIFVAALDLPEAARAAYLDRECSGDGELRAEIDAMLAAHTGAADVEDPGSLLPSGAERPASTARAGTRVGPYRLEELIGRGGMGEVYRAERVDGHYSQAVAIKLVRLGLTDEMVRRFALERQILARLDHPNIAILLDGGVSEGGQPYLVMQYVAGVPITEHVTTHRSSTEERLRLFAAVCDAVQFAHANLVVHRDLKPSNILVTGDGQVRLLDFGIAKLLDPTIVGGVAAATGDLRLLTPDYATPEQLLGEPITTATDVYALGALLYELLTGSKPHRATSTADLHRAICEREPERPSARLRTVHADLDHVILMTLRKEPERRYASAGQLGEDVRRFLRGVPVIARPDTLGYRARKFVGRNRLAVAAAAAIVLTLVGATVVTAHESRQRQIALLEAEIERDEAAEIAEFVIGIFDVNDPSRTRGQVVTARELLERAATRIETELETQPIVRAAMESAIARAYGKLGLLDAARPIAEQALERRRASLRDDHPDVAASLEHVGRVLASQGEFVAALERLDEAAAMHETAERRADVARIVATAGRIELDLRRHDAARDKLERALEIQQSLGDAHATARTLRWLGHVAVRENQPQRALELAEEALETARAAVDADDPFLYLFEEDIAIALEGLDRAEEAIAVHRRMLESRERVYGPDHLDVAFSLYNLGRAKVRLRRFEEALPLYARALKIREDRLRPDHPQIGHVLLSYAIATGAAGDPEVAIARCERTRAIYESCGDDEGVLLALEGIAMWQTVLDRTERALTALETMAERGYANVAKLSQRPFEKLAEEPRFQSVLAQVREHAARRD